MSQLLVARRPPRGVLDNGQRGIEASAQLLKLATPPSARTHTPTADYFSLSRSTCLTVVAAVVSSHCTSFTIPPITCGRATEAPVSCTPSSRSRNPATTPPPFVRKKKKCQTLLTLIIALCVRASLRPVALSKKERRKPVRRRFPLSGLPVECASLYLRLFISVCDGGVRSTAIFPPDTLRGATLER